MLGAGCGAVGFAAGIAAPAIYKRDVPSMALDVFDYRKLAKNRLPKIVFDFLEGGSGSERSLTHNLEVFDRISLKPRRLADFSKRNLAKEILGKKRDLPFMIGPTGGNGALWPDADIALAKAAEKANVPFSLSTASTSSIEELAKNANGDRWFQLYVSNREQSEAMVKRALDAGYSTLVVTLDVAVNGLRYRDQRNGFKIPIKMSPHIIWDGMTHPGWSYDYMMNGEPQLANFVNKDATDTASQKAAMSRSLDASFDWDSLQWLRGIWPHKLLVKGILNADDAVKCIENGADGVILSNHGGRQLSEVISPLQVLAETRKKMDSGTLLIDSGYRRGSDIVKALALGADGVLLGRATLYGVAANGEDGVSDVISILKNEVDNTLAQIGCADVNDLDSSYLMEDKTSLIQAV